MENSKGIIDSVFVNVMTPEKKLGNLVFKATFSLFFTEDKIIFAKVKELNMLEKYAETMGSQQVSIFPVQSNTYKKSLGKTNELSKLDPSAILSNDKDNFEVSYSDLSKVIFYSAIGPAILSIRPATIIFQCNDKKINITCMNQGKFDDYMKIIQVSIPKTIQIIDGVHSSNL